MRSVSYGAGIQRARAIENEEAINRFSEDLPQLFSLPEMMGSRLVKTFHRSIVPIRSHRSLRLAMRKHASCASTNVRQRYPRVKNRGRYVGQSLRESPHESD